MLKKYYKLSLAVILPAWVFVSFILAQLVVVFAVWLLKQLGLSVSTVNKSVLGASIAAAVYIITLLVTIFGPRLFKRGYTSKKEIGFDRLPTWTEVFITPAGFVIYLIIAAILMLLMSKIIPGFEPEQVQEIGFSQLTHRYEYFLAFGTLVLVAPIAEELLFRGYLFGKLKSSIPVWAAIIITSTLFGVVHGAWNIGVDTFALSIVLCSLRLATGSIWPSILLHMLKNSIAFYILFVNPILSTMVFK